MNDEAKRTLVCEVLDVHRELTRALRRSNDLMDAIRDGRIETRDAREHNDLLAIRAKSGWERLRMAEREWTDIIETPLGKNAKKIRE